MTFKKIPFDKVYKQIYCADPASYNLTAGPKLMAIDTILKLAGVKTASSARLFANSVYNEYFHCVELNKINNRTDRLDICIKDTACINSRGEYVFSCEADENATQFQERKLAFYHSMSQIISRVFSYINELPSDWQSNIINYTNFMTKDIDRILTNPYSSDFFVQVFAHVNNFKQVRISLINYMYSQHCGIPFVKSRIPGNDILHTFTHNVTVNYYKEHQKILTDTLNSVSALDNSAALQYNGENHTAI